MNEIATAVVVIILPLTSMAATATTEIFCFIQGLVSKQGQLNGTFHSCEPSDMSCAMINRVGANLDSNQETVNCVQEGLLWNVEHHCSFVHLTRKSYCHTMRHCYGIKMRCPSSNFVMSSFSQIGLAIIASVMLLAMVIIVLNYARNARRSRKIDVAVHSRRISGTSPATNSSTTIP